VTDMTETASDRIETETAAPKASSRPRPARAPARTRPNGTSDQLAEMQRQIDELKSGQFLPPAPPPGPAPQTSVHVFTSFQEELQKGTRPVPADFMPSSVAYNWPQRWYCKTDGEIVQLQGDPNNQALYRDKGYLVLDADQVARWLGGERDKVVKLQRRKAQLVGGIRRQIAIEPKLAQGLDPDFDKDLDLMTIPELEQLWDQLVAHSDSPRINLPRPQRLVDAEQRREEAASKKLLAGVESGERTMEELDGLTGTERPNMPAMPKPATRTRGNGRTVEFVPGKTPSVAY
jgi:hypothetical protein